MNCFIWQVKYEKETFHVADLLRVMMEKARVEETDSLLGSVWKRNLANTLLPQSETFCVCLFAG